MGGKKSEVPRSSEHGAGYFIELPCGENRRLLSQTVAAVPVNMPRVGHEDVTSKTFLPHIQSKSSLF